MQRYVDHAIALITMHFIHSFYVILVRIMQLAAQRFVNYWNSRKEAFGERFTEKMTLSGAMRDDLVALEAGVYHLLPKPDASGRLITYLETRRNTGRGYSSDSLVSTILGFVQDYESLTDSRYSSYYSCVQYGM